MTKKLILDELKRTKGSLKKTAQNLNMSYSALNKKLRDFCLLEESQKIRAEVALEEARAQPDPPNFNPKNEQTKKMLRALIKESGNITRSAKSLKMNRNSFIWLLKDLGLVKASRLIRSKAILNKNNSEDCDEIRKAIIFNEGNIAKIARVLKISRTTAYYKIKHYKLEPIVRSKRDEKRNPSETILAQRNTKRYISRVTAKKI